MESDRPSGGKHRNNFLIFRLKIRNEHIYLAAEMMAQQFVTTSGNKHLKNFF
jgi:hypothetical protein